MNTNPTAGDDRSKNATGAHSMADEAFDLMFNLDDDDLEMNRDRSYSKPQQLCDNISSCSSSTSSSLQRGYVMISYTRQGLDGQRTFTDICASDTLSIRRQTTSKEEGSKTESPSPTTASIYSFLSPAREEQTNTTSSPSIHLDASQESTRPPTPEPITPLTRQFREDMLSVLSLLPPWRYPSPPSRALMDHVEEEEIGDSDSDSCVVFRVPPTSAAPIDLHSGDSPLFTPSH
ncbi:hypothetical protein F4802DRAFT_597659 [Xylaria palmicola]|nr:hypothetical protein F4802DRAFT_597659 [Xylaria palmicola]